MKTYLFNNHLVFLAHDEDVDAVPLETNFGVGGYRIEDIDKLHKGCSLDEPYDDYFCGVTDGDGSEEIVIADVVDFQNEGQSTIEWCTKEYALIDNLKLSFSKEYRNYLYSSADPLLRVVEEASKVYADGYTNIAVCEWMIDKLSNAAENYTRLLNIALDECRENGCKPEAVVDYDTAERLGVSEMIERLQDKINRM